MKISTITCHKVYNYGATLQAYALQKYLEVSGHQVSIIDFRPWYNNDRYNVFYYNRNKSGRMTLLMNKIPLLRYLYLPFAFYCKGRPITWDRKKPFDDFDKRYLHLTNRTYYTSNQLRNNPPQADVYIAGSDQIWNTYCENGKEPGYYLDFGNQKTRRISYAASVATDNIAKECIAFVRKQLSNFDCISVRESSSIQALKEIGINNVSCVLDPVFLISKANWIEMAVKANKYTAISEPYLLVYDFIGNDINMKEFAVTYAKKKNLHVVSINDYAPRNYANININDAGPLEFLSLLMNAECIISSSFHATAFSVIFNKEFYSFPLIGQNNSARMRDLLFNLGLDKRFKPEKEDDYLIFYESVNRKLYKQIIYSKEYLKKSIENV